MCQVPARVELPGAGHRDPGDIPLQRLERLDGLLQILLGAKDADQGLHRLLKLRVDLVRRRAAGPLERGQHLALRGVDLSWVQLGVLWDLLRVLGGSLPERRPKTRRSESEFPPRRFEPCMPPEASPAA